MIFYKVEAYLGKERQCLNVVCEHCLLEVVKEYKVKKMLKVFSTEKKCYWCDNCLAGINHPLFEQKMAENKLRKGYV